jgi:hypothetical protein
MTLGDQIVQRTLEEVIGKTVKPSTKRILNRCLPSLHFVINELASEEAGKMALPNCYGRPVIFASPIRGMVCDMLRWSDPLTEVSADDKEGRAGIWAAMAIFIHRANSHGALTTLATRLGAEGMAQFDETLARLDNSTGEFVYNDLILSARGALVVLAGVERGASAGIIGAIAVPVLTKPGPVADWHETEWNADGNHRRLH